MEFCGTIHYTTSWFSSSFCIDWKLEHKHKRCLPFDNVLIPNKTLNDCANHCKGKFKMFQYGMDAAEGDMRCICPKKCDNLGSDKGYSIYKYDPGND